jgi:hypothetical protein
MECKNNEPVLIGFYPILNANALSGLRASNRRKNWFRCKIIPENPEKVIAFRIG